MSGPENLTSQGANEAIRDFIRRKIGNLGWVYIKTAEIVEALGLSSKTVGCHLGRMARGDWEFGFEEWATSTPRTYRVWLKRVTW